MPIHKSVFDRSQFFLPVSVWFTVIPIHDSFVQFQVGFWSVSSLILLLRTKRANKLQNGVPFLLRFVLFDILGQAKMRKPPEPMHNCNIGAHNFHQFAEENDLTFFIVHSSLSSYQHQQAP
jgi:hypothetical protein